MLLRSATIRVLTASGLQINFLAVGRLWSIRKDTPRCPSGIDESAWGLHTFAHRLKKCMQLIPRRSRHCLACSTKQFDTLVVGSILMQPTSSSLLCCLLDKITVLISGPTFLKGAASVKSEIQTLTTDSWYKGSVHKSALPKVL